MAASVTYPVMEILPGDHIRIRGFRRQKSYDLK